MIRCVGGRPLMGRGESTTQHCQSTRQASVLFRSSCFLALQASLWTQAMLALITEKLQNQCLDDATAAAQAARFKVPASRDDVTKPDSTSATDLAVKGKNVWTMPLKSQSSGGKTKGGNCSGHGKSCDSHPLVVVCPHRFPVHKCPVCDNCSGTAPPRKRHCRSLSVPVESMTSSRQPDGAKLWRPIAVIPLTNNNIDQQNRNISSRAEFEFKPTCRNVANFSRFVSSPLSMDSGHFTTSDFQTPPGSPVPRPASALSDISHGSYGAPWLEHSPYKSSRFQMLQNRSLSCEEHVPQGRCSLSCDNQMPQGTRSTPCMNDSHRSNPSSPYRHRIPRCRSQPCVLHDRKFAKKRRRDDCRPTLNFHKMTETAYGRFRRSDPVNTPGVDFQKRNSHFHVELESSMSLMPIASSPLDNDIPARKMAAEPYPPNISELAGVASLQLPPTPPQSSSCSGFDIQQPVRLIGDEDGESGCGCRGDDLEDEGMELFPLTDLDIEQIENH